MKKKKIYGEFPVFFLAEIDAVGCFNLEDKHWCNNFCNIGTCIGNLAQKMN